MQGESILQVVSRRVGGLFVRGRIRMSFGGVKVAAGEQGMLRTMLHSLEG